MGDGSVQRAYLIGKESTWGTGVTTDKDIGIVTDGNPGGTRETITSRGIGQREVVCNQTGAEFGVQDVTLEFQNGRMFEFTIGDAAHVETTGDWVHTFTIDDLPDSFTSQSGSNLAVDIGQEITGNRIGSLELSVALNEVVKLSFSARGKYPTELGTTPAHIVSAVCPLNFSQTTISFNAVAVVDFQNFSVTFTSTLVDALGIGSVDPTNVIATDLTVEWSGTLTVDAITLGHIIDNDLTAITWASTNGTALGSGLVALNLALNDIEVDTHSVVFSEGALTTIEVSGRAALNTLTTTDQITSANWF